MGVIIAWLENFYQFLVTLWTLIFWLLDGVVALSPLLVKSLNVLGDVFKFFPEPIAGIILAIVGGTVALRLCMWR